MIIKINRNHCIITIYSFDRCLHVIMIDVHDAMLDARLAACLRCNNNKTFVRHIRSMRIFLMRKQQYVAPLNISVLN